MQLIRGDIIIRIALALSTAWSVVALGGLFTYFSFQPFFYSNFSQHYPPKHSELQLSEESIVAHGDYDVETLVRDIFVKGECENVSNIQSTGHKDGIGYFEKGESTIGLTDGIILATGNIRNSEGPNHVTDVSSFFDIGGDDRDLKKMVTEQLFDPVGLEFDFVPLDSFVTFRYVFASEEYCEFVGSIYNDVFGFFIRGPGIEGDFSQQAENVALIPGSEDEVSINSVNHQSNEAYFIQNYLTNDAQSCGLTFLPSPHIEEIEYDGFTQPMVASLKLIPCETYHIRMVISDVGDGFFDSAVFLEAGSFNIGGAVKVSGEIVEEKSSLIEGCSEGYLVFEREDLETLDYPLSVHFKVSPSSTAREGVDFEPLPNTVNIPAGETHARVPVYAINDNQQEGQESLVIELDIPCSCYQDSTILLIDDSPLLTLYLPEAIVCEIGETALQPDIQGGTPPFIYHWDDGSTEEKRMISAHSPSIFRLTITDQCGVQAIDSSFLQVQPPAEASLEEYVQVCAGDTAYLNLTFTGTPPWSFRYQHETQDFELVTDIYTTPYLLPVTEQGTYQLIDFFDAHCQGKISGSAQLSTWNIEVEANIQPTTCYDLQDGSIDIRITGGSPPYTWKWDHGPENTTEITHLAAGWYDLLVQDQNECSRSYSFEIIAPEPLQAIDFDCEDLRQSSIIFSAGGGAPPYLYSTDGHHFMDETLFDDLLPGQEYHIYIADASDCRLEQDFIMPTPYKNMASLPASVDLNKGSTHKIKPQLNIPESLLANVRWSPGDHLSCVNCLEPDIQALEGMTYTLHLKDVFGCSDEVTMQVNIDRSIDLFVPNAFSPNNDGLNDRFVIYGNAAQISQVRLLQIYDRWGNLLYAAYNFAINDETIGWDGYFRDQLMNTGSYVYHTQLELIDGSTQIRSGQVVLVK